MGKMSGRLTRRSSSAPGRVARAIASFAPSSCSSSSPACSPSPSSRSPSVSSEGRSACRRAAGATRTASSSSSSSSSSCSKSPSMSSVSSLNGLAFGSFCSSGMRYVPFVAHCQGPGGQSLVVARRRGAAGLTGLWRGFFVCLLLLCCVPAGNLYLFWLSGRGFGQQDFQEPIIVAGFDLFALNFSGNKYLDAERTVANLRLVVTNSIIMLVFIAPFAADHQRVLVKRDINILFAHASQFDLNGDCVGGLVNV